ncbi:antibiotic biosynthesis monooxygenase family protein [Burkholderia sp. Ac-20379]|uniref:antibiotic biosynthesis monooxygenase family protein n=1 Tax=Burkholderia sp. Ac-20379 TaxID=2703900 RepID=UPI001981C551|nr:antibiotic biosynthesis monooxygenase family protein [Burkholderia sp. Ac-20379]MBN3724535.1 antibiotic biosynthesis monooxygenase [Burkholderia sp. Ac-20379]
MIFELADIEILPGHTAEFEAGVREALALFARAAGCHGAKVHRVIEKENHYVLQVGWDTVDDHMVTFRESPDFQTWRSLVGPHFARPPQVVHTQVAVE